MTRNDTEELAKKRMYFILNVHEPTFIDFAQRCGMNPQELLSAIEHAILTRHREAIPYSNPGHPHTIWQLELKNVSFSYQVLPGDIEVAGLICRFDGLPYEPSQDLLADFSE